jgi:hypothetical protein
MVNSAYSSNSYGRLQEVRENEMRYPGGKDEDGRGYYQENHQVQGCVKAIQATRSMSQSSENVADYCISAIPSHIN